MDTHLIPTKNPILNGILKVLMFYVFLVFVPMAMYYAAYSAFLFSLFLNSMSTLTSSIEEKMSDPVKIRYLVRQTQLLFITFNNTSMDVISIVMLNIFSGSVAFNYTAIKLICSGSTHSGNLTFEDQALQIAGIINPPAAAVTIWILIWLVFGIPARAETVSQELLCSIKNMDASGFNQKFQRSSRPFHFHFCRSCNITRSFFLNMVSNSINFTIGLVMST